MDRKTYQQLVEKYKTQARDRHKLEKERRRKLPFAQRWGQSQKDRQAAKALRLRSKKAADPAERKAQAKGHKLYRKLRSRPYKWMIAGLILLIIIAVCSRWYFVATRPLNPSQQAARDHSLEVAEQVMDESIVLLRNEREVLPLKATKLSVFGAGSAAPVYGGGGAGGIASSEVQSLYDSLSAAGFSYNEPLYNLYSNYAVHGRAETKDFKKPGGNLLTTLLPSVAGFIQSSPKEMPADHLTDAILRQAAEYSDTALYTISRAGMETIDFKPGELKLTPDEQTTLAKLDKNFKHIIVLANTTNAIELGFVEQLQHVDGVLWVGAPGEVGTRSIAKVLNGKVNPSGHLADTYTYNIEDNPAVRNTGDFQYVDNGEPSKRYFANNQEGIYVGYRYYETFLSGQEYGDVVQYPFGYGLSYTEFSYQKISSTANADTISATVRVTNTGQRAGKDVVQLYYDPPYATGGIEKSATVLGGYAKTDTLSPGESEDVVISFKTDTMASYDDKVAKTWVLEAGDYTIRIARDIRTALDEFSYRQPETKIIRQDAATGQTITNRFDGADGGLTYLSRSDPAGTFPVAPTGDALQLPQQVRDSEYVHQKSTTTPAPTGEKHGLQLRDMKGVAYDDPKWQTFVRQLTDAELVKLAGNGGYWSVPIKRLGVPKTTMYDGPASIRNFLGAWSTVAYPTPVNLAAGWNDALSEKMGQAMGKEARSFDVDAVYAPSLNLHRSPLGGRNFEYYSEDPLIAGKIGAAYTRGLQSTETVAVMKHFAANEQETNRANYGLYVWGTEQSFRELYLKPFELTVKEGKAHGAMSAFNRIGSVWAGGSKPLLTEVLRNEWGFTGFVLTDAGIAGQGNHFNALQAVEAGNDLMLANIISTPLDGPFEKELKKYLKEDRAGTVDALQSAAHNLLYYVLETSKL